MTDRPSPGTAPGRNGEKETEAGIQLCSCINQLQI